MKYYKVNITKHQRYLVTAQSSEKALERLSQYHPSIKTWHKKKSKYNNQGHETAVFVDNNGNEIKVKETGRETAYYYTDKDGNKIKLKAKKLKGAMNTVSRKGITDTEIYNEYDKLLAVKENNTWHKL